MPLGVDTIIILVLVPAVITGYTEVINSEAILDGTKANSSSKTQLYDPERAAEEDVESAVILEPFSSSM